MQIDERLTILLTLRGRHLFTLRWLWHANQISLPFRIFVADGQVHPTIARLVEDSRVFPNLVLEYHKYDDRTFFDFYKKLDDAVSRVKTPYVMMADNDDFLLPSGLIKSLYDLDHLLDYVCAGGAIAHFELQAARGHLWHLTGNIRKLWYQQSQAYQAFDLNSSIASQRIVNVYRHALTVHYNIYRLEALRCLASEQVKHNFRRLESAELFWKLRTTTLGKLKSDPTCLCYLRQIGTSLNPVRQDDFLEILRAGLYVDEAQDVLGVIASIASNLDNINRDVVETQLHEIFLEHLRIRLVQIFGWRSAVKSCFKEYLPQAVLRWLQLIGEWIRSGRSSAAGGRPVSRERLFEMMTKAGASVESLEKQKKELADIERTLKGEQFLAFLHHRAPELVASAPLTGMA